MSYYLWILHSICILMVGIGAGGAIRRDISDSYEVAVAIWMCAAALFAIAASMQ